MYYLYYILYKFVLLTPSRNEFPEHIANIIFALLLCFNLFAIINILQYYNAEWLDDFYKRKTIFIIIYLLLLLIGYFVFIKNSKYLKLKYKYDKEKKKKKNLKTSLVLFYILGVIVLLFIF